MHRWSVPFLSFQVTFTLYLKQTNMNDHALQLLSDHYEYTLETLNEMRRDKDADPDDIWKLEIARDSLWHAIEAVHSKIATQ